MWIDGAVGRTSRKFLSVASLLALLGGGGGYILVAPLVVVLLLPKCLKNKKYVISNIGIQYSTIYNKPPYGKNFHANHNSIISYPLYLCSGESRLRVSRLTTLSEMLLELNPVHYFIFIIDVLWKKVWNKHFRNACLGSMKITTATTAAVATTTNNKNITRA